jgi:hypothetical protein
LLQKTPSYYDLLRQLVRFCEKSLLGLNKSLYNTQKYNPFYLIINRPLKCEETKFTLACKKVWINNKSWQNKNKPFDGPLLLVKGVSARSLTDRCSLIGPRGAVVWG